MKVNTQVSGLKNTNITPSKNLGTKVNTIVPGTAEHPSNISSDAQLGYKKVTDVLPTQVSGEVHNTNYMGINDEGMDIREAKKITGNELNVETNPTAYFAKDSILAASNTLIAEQEMDKKIKNRGASEGGDAPIESFNIDFGAYDETEEAVVTLGERGLNMSIETKEGVQLVNLSNRSYTEYTVTSNLIGALCTAYLKEGENVLSSHNFSLNVTEVNNKVYIKFDPNKRNITGSYVSDRWEEEA
ncbi:MAG: hypothetical protein MJ191_00165 [Clostridium sp.]|nr:hypothetical protein [Clostridium sp.]